MRRTKFRGLSAYLKLPLLMKLQLRYKIGDAFITLPVSEVQELLSQSSSRIDDMVSGIEENLSTVREEMEQLKMALYARFGKSINLET